MGKRTIIIMVVAGQASADLPPGQLRCGKSFSTMWLTMFTLCGIATVHTTCVHGMPANDHTRTLCGQNSLVHVIL